MADDDYVIIDRHLYLTEDGCRVVEESDSRQRWLHWSPGARVLKRDYEQLTQEDEVVEPPKVKTPPPPPPVRRHPEPPKYRRPQGNK